MSASININGVHITGASITVNNNRVLVDGADVTPDAKEIRIEVTGDVAALNVDDCRELTIHGNAAMVRTMSGDVYCDSVTGGIETMAGEVNCAGIVNGNVTTMSGNISLRPMVRGTRG